MYPFFDGELWLEMLKDRNDMAHVYDGNAAKKLAIRIIKEYVPQFINLEKEITTYYGDILKTI